MLWYVKRTARSTQNKNFVWWEAGCFFSRRGRYLRCVDFLWLSLPVVSVISIPGIWNGNVEWGLFIVRYKQPAVIDKRHPTCDKMLKNGVKAKKSLTSQKIINQDELWDKISLCSDKKSDWCFEKSFNPTKSELNGKLSNAFSNRHI